jgi:hypothetical protein
MSWMTGLGQGLLGASDVFSRYLVDKEDRKRRDEDVKHRSERERIEDEFRKSTEARYDAESKATAKYREEQTKRAQLQDERALVKDVLGSLSIDGRTRIDSATNDMAKRTGLGSFVQDSTPTQMFNPFTGTPFAGGHNVVDAGPTAEAMVSPLVREQIMNFRADNSLNEFKAEAAAQARIQQLQIAAQQANTAAERAQYMAQIADLQSDIRNANSKNKAYFDAVKAAQDDVKAMFGDQVLTGNTLEQANAYGRQQLKQHLRQVGITLNEDPKVPDPRQGGGSGVATPQGGGGLGIGNLLSRAKNNLVDRLGKGGPQFAPPAAPSVPTPSIPSFSMPSFPSLPDASVHDMPSAIGGQLRDWWNQPPQTPLAPLPADPLRDWRKRPTR